MHSVSRLIALTALAASPLAAQSTVSGAFITRLGTDTVAIEQYTH